jgi:hypothetical protein
MAENRWQIIIGAGVLLLMLLAGTFSLGIYIGRHGLSREGLRYQHPVQAMQQVAPQNQEPRGRPEGIPEGQPDLIGRLRRGSKEGIELATEKGIRFVAIDEDTKLLDEEGNPLKGTNLQVGDILAIFGEYSVNEGQQLLAYVIVRLPKRSVPQP